MAIILLLLIGLTTYSQTNDSIVPPSRSQGEEGLFNSLGRNSKYPATVLNQAISGIVYSSFIVNSNGQIDSIWIVKSAHPTLDQEVIKCIKLLDTWNPAAIEGQPVSTRINLPFGFYIGTNPVSTATPKIYQNDVYTTKSTLLLDEFMLIRRKEAVGFATDQNTPVIYLSDTNYELAMAAYKNGKYDEALTLFNNSYRGDPGNSEILYYRGLTLHQLGKTKGACKDWSKASKKGNKEAIELLQKHCTK